MPQVCLARRLHQMQSHAVVTGPAIPGALLSPAQLRMVWALMPQDAVGSKKPFLAPSCPPNSLLAFSLKPSPVRHSRRGGGGRERERESFAPALPLHTDSFANFPELACSLPPDFLPGSPGPQLPAPSASLPHPGLPHPWAGLGPSHVPLRQPLWGLFWSCSSCLAPPPPRPGLRCSHLLLVTVGIGTVKGGGMRNGEARGARRCASMAHRHSTTLLLRALPQGSWPCTPNTQAGEVPGYTLLPLGWSFQRATFLSLSSAPELWVTVLPRHWPLALPAGGLSGWSRGVEECVTCLGRGSLSCRDVCFASSVQDSCYPGCSLDNLQHGTDLVIPCWASCTATCPKDPRMAIPQCGDQAVDHKTAPCQAKQATQGGPGRLQGGKERLVFDLGRLCWGFVHLETLLLCPYYSPSLHIL